MSPTFSLVRKHYTGLRSLVYSRRFTTKSTDELLNWPQYLAIRSAKRKWELVCALYPYLVFLIVVKATTIPSTILGFGLGVSYFGQLEGNSLIMASIINSQ